MDFKRITNQAQEKVAEVAVAAQEKVDAVIDEFNNMLPVAEELGLKLTSFNIEAGILPQVNATLVGSIDNIKNEAVECLIAANESNKLLVSVLNAILMAKSIHQRLGVAYISILKDLIIDVKLGVPPSISCHFKSHH
jgi:hemoglobin-like flavoprotein